MAEPDITKLPVPEVSDELMRWLRAMHPVYPIGEDETLAQANRKAGVQDLIKKLGFFNRLQAKAEADSFEDEDDRKATLESLVWEAPTKEQEEHGFVLRVS